MKSNFCSALVMLYGLLCVCVEPADSIIEGTSNLIKRVGRDTIFNLLIFKTRGVFGLERGLIEELCEVIQLELRSNV